MAKATAPYQEGRFGLLTFSPHPQPLPHQGGGELRESLSRLWQ